MWFNVINSIISCYKEITQRCDETIAEESQKKTSITSLFLLPIVMPYTCAARVWLGCCLLLQRNMYNDLKAQVDSQLAELKKAERVLRHDHPHPSQPCRMKKRNQLAPYQVVKKLQGEVLETMRKAIYRQRMCLRIKQGPSASCDALLAINLLLLTAIEYRKLELVKDVGRCASDPFLETHVCLRTNVSHLKHADWVCFAETHTDRMCRLLNKAVMAYLYNAARRDTCWIEGNLSESPAMIEQLGVPPGARVKGWDDQETLKNALNWIAEAASVFVAVVNYPEDCDDYDSWLAAFDKWITDLTVLKDKLNLEPSFQKIIEKDSFQFSNLDLFRDDPQSRELFAEYGVKYFKAMFIKLYLEPIVMGSIFTSFNDVIVNEEDFNKRQNKLNVSISTSSNSGRKNYLISGEAHLKPVEGFLVDSTRKDLDKLYKTLDRIPHAILIPAQSAIILESIKPGIMQVGQLEPLTFQPDSEGKVEMDIHQEVRMVIGFFQLNSQNLWSAPEPIQQLKSTLEGSKAVLPARHKVRFCSVGMVALVSVVMAVAGSAFWYLSLAYED